MKLLHLLAATFFVLIEASAAYAGGDLTDYTPPPAPVSACGGPFSGWYGGALLGFGGASSKFSSGPNSAKANDRGFTGGGVAGYNWQCNGRLIGIESDISYFNANAEFDCTTCGGSVQVGSEMNWFGTLRGRVGLVGDENFLVFATAGLAYGGVDHKLALSSGPDDSGPFSGSQSDTEIGWTVGGGIDYLLSDHWSFRADALYVDFGSDDVSFTTGSCGRVCTTHIDYDDNFWVARVGLTYLFNSVPAPVVPEYGPLK